MPRLSSVRGLVRALVGALLAIGALGCFPVSAQNSGASRLPDSAPKNARVQQVIVRGARDATEVEIQTSGTPVVPNIQAITGPDRILVDFPGALPAAELRALTVNRGALKGVRSGLFFSKPPITRIVLDLTEPQSYEISTVQGAVVVRLKPAKLDAAKPAPAIARAQTGNVTSAPSARLQKIALVPGTPVAAPVVSVSLPQPTVEPVPAALPPKPAVTVTLVDGMLRIHAEKATLAQVLFEVQRQTQAEIAIPAGAESEQVIADLGPAPARDVLAALLNGTPYNFIFVGDELRLERVLLTLREP